MHSFSWHDEPRHHILWLEWSAFPAGAGRDLPPGSEPAVGSVCVGCAASCAGDGDASGTFILPVSCFAPAPASWSVVPLETPLVGETAALVSRQGATFGSL